MATREGDIQELCRQVAESAVRWEGCPNGGDRYYCVFCDEDVTDGRNVDGSEIKHLSTCAVLVAKDLSTK